MFETVQQLLRARMHEDTPAVIHHDRTWTWREHLTEAAAEASTLIGLADNTRPLHVGALLGNSPAMLRSMAAPVWAVACCAASTPAGAASGCWPTSVAQTASCCLLIPTTCRCSTGWTWPLCPQSPCSTCRRAVTSTRSRPHRHWYRTARSGRAIP